jgi:hypothetical protein
MEIWYTWLAYFGLLFGIVASGLFGTPLTRSAVIGFAAGIGVVLLVNFVDPTPAPCLQNSKGWDILRAYSFNCVK